MEYPHVWELGEEFTQFSVVRHNEKYYTCIIDHVSSNGTEPEVGSNWKTYWVLSSFNYLPKYNQGQEFFFPFFDIILKSEVITISGPPSGPTIGVVESSYSFSGIGSSSYSHPIEYQFDWVGDGSDLSPWNSSTQSKTWTVYGDYNVKIRVRCNLDPTIMSDWSSVHLISIAGVGPGHDVTCITDCAACSMPTHVPIFSYTTQQMTCSGTQNISATGGGGGPYIWSILSGGGTLSKAQTDSDENNLYTAPASNSNCSNNPTIQVTDFCGNYATIKFAINCYVPTGVAYRNYFCADFCDSCGTGNCTGCTHPPYDVCCGFRARRDSFNCDSSQNGSTFACGSCSLAAFAGSCADCYTAISGCSSCTQAMQQNCSGHNPGETEDTRSGAMLSGGCCPATLL